MASPSGTWITTTEAAQRLGVKRATLYAYVSRGLLRSERRPGQQESLFDRTQIDAMASATRPPGSPQPVLRFRSIATSVSSQVDGDLLYRGRPLQDVVAVGSLDDAAAIVLGSSVPQQVPRLSQVAGVDLSALPLERRMPVAIQLVAAADPFASDTDPEQVRTAAIPALGAALTLVSGAAAPDPVTTDLTALTLAALGGSPDARDDVELLRVLLVALLDHGLTASTVAARVAASTRAGLHDCLLAAYAAMAGALHGAAPVARALRTHGVVPGFGHFLYPDGDPRADVVLDRVRRLPGGGAVLERVEA